MQNRNAEDYAKHARFVTDPANPAVELLAPSPWLGPQRVSARLLQALLRCEFLVG